MKSRNALTEHIIKIRKGLAIYKVGLSPYWQCRMRVPQKRGYLVRSTQETSRVEARKAAEELYLSLSNAHVLDAVRKDHTFGFYADRLIKQQDEAVKNQALSNKQARTDEWIIYNQKFGLAKHFGSHDVKTIRTKEVTAYFDMLRGTRSTPYSFTTINNIISVIRKVLRLAQYDGLITSIPETQRPHRQDNPRPFFRFSPLVSKENDEYQCVLKTAKQMEKDQVKVRWIPVTSELYDFILFLMHSFLRPTVTEVMSLRHRDVVVADNPKRLILTVKKGKTGYRQSNSLEAAVSVYERCKSRYPNTSLDDYVFLPHYQNRMTAMATFQRQFRELLKRANLRRDEYARTPHSLYSLRHTALCMRLVLSQGKVNIFNLAVSAGTSVDQLQRFYLKKLPPSPEMARNLQTFGDD